MRPTGAGVAFAALAALLFGLVSVVAKGSALAPLVQGGIAYLLAGLALAPALRGARVERTDRAKVVAMALVGGALAPALLFYGLQRTTALDASLLLTLEMVFTALLAAIFLRERVRGRALAGVALLFVAALLVAAASATQAGRSTLVGAALVGLAALGWGIDNTLSARLVGTYKPQHLIAIKGLLGGATALLVAAALREPFVVSAPDAVRVAAIGLLGIGASVVLFYHALRRIGATLASAIFLPASALAGAFAAFLVLREPVSSLHGVGGLLLAMGLFLLAKGSRTS